MVFIFRTGIIHLDRQVVDERLLPGRDVQLEESVQGVVNRGANEVAACNYPSREQTHNNVRYPTRKKQVPPSGHDFPRVIKMAVEGANHPQWPSLLVWWV